MRQALSVSELMMSLGDLETTYETDTHYQRQTHTIRDDMSLGGLETTYETGTRSISARSISYHQEARCGKYRLV